MKRFREIFTKKVVTPLLNFLKQGITPKKLALCIALGAVLGLFPVIGSTTFLCFVAAFALRLNVAAMQLVNYLIYPLQLILIIPFINAGSWIMGVNPIPYTVEEMITIVTEDIVKAFWMFGYAQLLGVLAWVIIAIPVALLLFLIFRFVFERMDRNTQTAEYD